jgi:hypothetical protein
MDHIYVGAGLGTHGDDDEYIIVQSLEDMTAEQLADDLHMQELKEAG